MVNNNMDNNKIITFEIPKGYKLKQRIFDKFVFEKMNDRPTDIKEVLEILDLSMLTEGNYRKEQLNTLQQLLIFRDAWWKMADDWKPDYNDCTEDKYFSTKFFIYMYRNEIHFGSCELTHHLLAFPTAEMRDAFYENFKELIDKCKELL